MHDLYKRPCMMHKYSCHEAMQVKPTTRKLLEQLSIPFLNTDKARISYKELYTLHIWAVSERTLVIRLNVIGVTHEVNCGLGHFDKEPFPLVQCRHQAPCTSTGKRRSFFVFVIWDYLHFILHISCFCFHFMLLFTFHVFTSIF